MLVLRGFSEAVARFNMRMQDTDFWEDPAAIQVSVTEAMWWAISADEEFENQAGGDYRRARDSDMNGQVLRGIRYIRNRCGHQRAIAPEDKSFRFSLKGYGFDEGEFGPSLRWRPTSDLPPPSSGYEKSNAKLEPHYQQHLEGQPVQKAFIAAATWFKGEQRRIQEEHLPPANR